MALTYNTFTNVATGDTLTATNYNNLLTNANNYRKPPMALVVPAATAAITNNTDTALGFQSTTNLVDVTLTTGSTSTTIANGGKLTINTAGVYKVAYSAGFAANATGQRIATIALNGTGSPSSATGYFASVFGNPSGTNGVTLSGGGLMSLAVNDYLQLVVAQTSGGNLNANTYTGSNFISVVWVGQLT